MIPVLSRVANILKGLNRAEFDEMFQRIGPNTYRIKQPVNLQNPTTQSLRATAHETAHTPGVHVYEGTRSTSRKEIYIDLNAGRGYRPQMYFSNGTHIVTISIAHNVGYGKCYLWLSKGVTGDVTSLYPVQKLGERLEYHYRFDPKVVHQTRWQILRLH